MLHISVWDKTLIHYWQLLPCQELAICAHKWNCSDVKMPLAADGFCLFWQLSNRCQPHLSWQNTDHFCFIKNLRLSHMTEIFLIISWLWLHMASLLTVIQKMSTASTDLNLSFVRLLTGNHLPIASHCLSPTRLSTVSRNEQWNLARLGETRLCPKELKVLHGTQWVPIIAAASTAKMIN